MTLFLLPPKSYQQGNFAQVWFVNSTYSIINFKIWQNSISPLHLHIVASVKIRIFMQQRRLHILKAELNQVATFFSFLTKLFAALSSNQKCLAVVRSWSQESEESWKRFDPTKEEELSWEMPFYCPYSPLQGLYDIEVPNIAVSQLGTTTTDAIEPRWT